MFLSLSLSHISVSVSISIFISLNLSKHDLEWGLTKKYTHSWDSRAKLGPKGKSSRMEFQPSRRRLPNPGYAVLTGGSQQHPQRSSAQQKVFLSQTSSWIPTPRRILLLKASKILNYYKTNEQPKCSGIPIFLQARKPHGSLHNDSCCLYWPGHTTPRGRRGRDTHPVVPEFNPGLALPVSKKRSMRGQARGAVGLRSLFTTSSKWQNAPLEIGGYSE